MFVIVTGQAFIQRKLVVLIQEEITKERKRESRSARAKYTRATHRALP